MPTIKARRRADDYQSGLLLTGAFQFGPTLALGRYIIEGRLGYWVEYTGQGVNGGPATVNGRVEVTARYVAADPGGGVNLFFPAANPTQLSTQLGQGLTPFFEAFVACAPPGADGVQFGIREVGDLVSPGTVNTAVSVEFYP